MNVFENEEFTTRTKKDHGIAIHPSLMSAADDEKKSGEVRDVNFLYLYVQFLKTFILQAAKYGSYLYTMNPLVDYSIVQKVFMKKMEEMNVELFAKYSCY